MPSTYALIPLAFGLPCQVRISALRKTRWLGNSAVCPCLQLVQPHKNLSQTCSVKVTTRHSPQLPMT